MDAAFDKMKDFPQWLDRIHQDENMDWDEVKEAIESMLSSFEFSYQNIKEYLKAASKSRFYNIKKALIDILEKEETLKVHRQYMEEIKVNTKFGAALLMIDSVTSVYLLAIVVRNKVQTAGNPGDLLIRLATIIRESKALHEDIRMMVEMRAQS